MLATVAWFFWNPEGWVFEWEPIVVFLGFLAGFIGAEIKGAPTISINNTTHQNDIDLFNDFLTIFPSETFIEFLKGHDFLIDFELESLRPLNQFIYEWDNAEHEFQNQELEQLRSQLMELANDLSNKIGMYSSPNTSGRQAVRVDRRKHQDEHEARFQKEATEINDSADAFTKKQQELVRKGMQLCTVARQSN